MAKLILILLGLLGLRLLAALIKAVWDVIRSIFID